MNKTNLSRVNEIVTLGKERCPQMESFFDNLPIDDSLSTIINIINACNNAGIKGDTYEEIFFYEYEKILAGEYNKNRNQDISNRVRAYSKQKRFAGDDVDFLNDHLDELYCINYNKILDKDAIESLIKLTKLGEREKNILQLRYENLVQAKEIAKMYNCTAFRIFQIEQSSLSKLKSAANRANQRYAGSLKGYNE